MNTRIALELVWLVTYGVSQKWLGRARAREEVPHDFWDTRYVRMCKPKVEMLTQSLGVELLGTCITQWATCLPAPCGTVGTLKRWVSLVLSLTLCSIAALALS